MSVFARKTAGAIKCRSISFSMAGKRWSATSALPALLSKTPSSATPMRRKSSTKAAARTFGRASPREPRQVPTGQCAPPHSTPKSVICETTGKLERQGEMENISRRAFLSCAAGALVAPRTWAAWPKTAEVPTLLDHVLLGSSDLERGIAFVEQHTGVRASFGGVHPGRGTQNALLSLGERRYLEIIAPDPQQQGVTWPLLATLKQLSRPKLVGWAAHPRNIAALAAQLKRSGIAADGPTPGSRKRPDGKVLHWQTLNLKDYANGLLPFFIKWSADSVHPSYDAPSGCTVLRLELLTPDPAALARLASAMSLDVPVAKATTPQLRAVIRGHRGTLDITS